MEQNVLEKFNMSGRTVLVTGAGGLLGKQFSLALAQAGANMVLADLAEDQAQAQAEYIRSLGLSAEALRVDVIDPNSTRAMVARTLERFGRLDVLINSAAMDRNLTRSMKGSNLPTLSRHIPSKTGARLWT